MLKLVTKPATKLGAEGGQALMQLIDASKRKDETYFKFHNNLRNLLSGEHWKNIKGKKKEQLKIVINLAHAHVRSLVPTLFFQNPTVDALPTSQLHAGKEVTWNSVINNTLSKIGFSKEIKAAVLDAVVYPEAVVKDILNKVDQISTEQDRSGPTEWLSKGTPTHIRLSPTQLIVDYLSKDRSLDNARFIAIRYRRPFDEMKKHPIYGKHIKRDRKVASQDTTGNLVGKNVVHDDWEDPDTYKLVDVYEDMVVFYEVWIHQLITNEGKLELYQQMCVLMEGQDEPIRELETWESVMGEGFNKYPVTRLVINPIPDAVPVAELQTWQGMQMAFNWLMSRIIQLVENDRLLYLFDPAKVKNFQKLKEQFYSGRSRELIEMTDMNGAAELLQPSFVGRDNYTVINLLQTLIQQVSGFGQNRRGGSGIRTASEAHIIEAGTQLKTDEKVDTVSKFLIEVITKTVIMIRAIAKQDRGVEWIFRQSGDIGTIKWTRFTAEDIDWSPDITIRVNSFRKQDGMQDMQKYMGLLNSAIGVYQLYGPQVRVDLLFARMLEAAGISDAGKIVGDQDAQTQLQMVEISAMIAGVPTPVLESHNGAVHIQVIDAFLESEIGQQLIQQRPELADTLSMHREEHVLMLQEQQQKAQQIQMAKQNPFSAVTEDTGNAQSEANETTAQDRTAFQALPGGRGAYQ